MATIDERMVLADRVANEALQGFNEHDGPKWVKVDGQEKAVRFIVDVPSIAGRTVAELNPGGFSSTGNFVSHLLSAGGRYVNGRLTGQTLHGVHLQLEILDGIYTGKATVSDRSGAFDYDL